MAVECVRCLGDSWAEEYWRREDCWKKWRATLAREGRAARRREEVAGAVLRGRAFARLRTAVVVAIVIVVVYRVLAEVFGVLIQVWRESE